MKIRNTVQRKKVVASDIAPSSFSLPTENLESSLSAGPQSAGHTFSNLAVVQPQASEAGDYEAHTRQPADQVMWIEKPVNDIGSTISTQQNVGNLAIQRMFQVGLIRAKLAISEPGDAYEQEAERVSNQVMQMPTPSPAGVRHDLVQAQRSCASCAPWAPCVKCEEEKIHRKAGDSRSPESSAAGSWKAAQLGDGEPLAATTRDFFERRFGTDFSQVRVHTDSKAADTAHSIQAKAFTIGQDVVFGAGQFAPESHEGRRLLAHELTHAIQQSKPSSAGETRPKDQRLNISLAESVDAPLLSSGDLMVQRQPIPKAALGGEPAPGGDVVKLGNLSVPIDDATLKKRLRLLYAQSSVEGMREFADQVREGVANRLDESGASDEVPSARRVKAELLDSHRLNDAIVEVIDESRKVADAFDDLARAQMDKILAADEARARTEVLHYGIPVDLSNKPSDQSFTFIGRPIADQPGVKGLSEAARALLRRLEEIAALRQKQEVSVPPSGGDQSASGEMQRLGEEIADKEVAYEVLFDQYLITYPMLTRFVNRNDLAGLRQLAAGPSADVQEAVGGQVLQTLLDIRTVRQALPPGGGVNIFKIPKMVALAKGAQGIAPASFENRAIDDRIEQIQFVEEIEGLALLVVNLALLATAPISGGASLALAAGLSTATAISHTQHYLLESAMAGSKLDRAKALSVGDPSLLWLAMDWVLAFSDLSLAVSEIEKAGRAAATAARLAKGYEALEVATREAKAAQTAAETAEKLKNLEVVATREGGQSLAKTIVHDAERLGGVGGKAGELASDLQKAEAAVDVAKGTLAKASTVTTGTGKVHVTESGQLFTCFNPCLNPRMRWAKVLVSDSEALGKLEQLEQKAAEATRGTMPSRDLIAREFATLDEQLARTGLQGLTRELAAWLPTLADRFPILKTLILDEDAIARIIAKRIKPQIKGQLVEELSAKQALGMIKSGEIAGIAGKTPELIPGHTLSERIINSRGQEQFIQFTDGLLGVRDGEAFQVLEILEAKAGGFSASKLEAETVGLERLSRADQRQLRLDAIEEFKAGKQSSQQIAELTAEQIDSQFKTQIDEIVKRQRILGAGQAAKSTERFLGGGQIFETLPDGTRQRLILKGRKSTTQVRTFTPSNVPVDAGSISKRDLINVTSTTLAIDAEDVEKLAQEIATRAKAF